jgi:uncharacterized protein (UPF0335 family)
MNDCLFSYLEKVHQLEWEKAELESHVQDLSKCHETSVFLDYHLISRLGRALAPNEV